MLRAIGTQYRLVGDDLGSTTLTLDTGSPPKVVYRAYYKPYGEVAFSSGTNQTSKGYTGQRLDTSSGLMYYGARYYDPVLSYFISPDLAPPKISLPESLNRLSYALNDPLRFTDPLGYGPKDYYVFVNGCGSTAIYLTTPSLMALRHREQRGRCNERLPGCRAPGVLY